MQPTFSCPTTLVRYSLIFLNPDIAQWQYDIDVRREADDETCLECVPILAAKPACVDMVTPVTMVYNAENKSRLELNN